ncbi:NnrU family protein [Marinobacterium jannaschii]|uniref:NnrU family protein n=1 Tax=Marinobacterium jannaschii TaxID=64970 RepID=UPI000480ADDC|nr:NnrU family protein [Marinobacterium jannaschii]
MKTLLGGLGLFLLIHMLPQVRPLRYWLRLRIGNERYLAFFSFFTLIALMLVGIGYSQTEVQLLWQRPQWTSLLTLVLMPFSLALILAAFQRCNLKRLTLHPMMWGISLWALAHLISNGSQRSLILFGTLGCFALYKQWVLRRRWPELKFARAPLWRDLSLALQALLLTYLMLQIHPWLFGVAAL